MSIPQVVLLISLILLVVTTLAAVLVIGLRRKAASSRAALAAVLASEPAILGPLSGVYRGTTGSYSRVSGNGQIALTRRRILFHKTVGGEVEVRLVDVTGVELQRTFNRSVVAGQMHLVVATRLGEVGFFVPDPESWRNAILAAR